MLLPNNIIKEDQIIILDSQEKKLNLMKDLLGSDNKLNLNIELNSWLGTNSEQKIINIKFTKYIKNLLDQVADLSSDGKRDLMSNKSFLFSNGFKEFCTRIQTDYQVDLLERLLRNFHPQMKVSFMHSYKEDFLRAVESLSSGVPDELIDSVLNFIHSFNIKNQVILLSNCTGLFAYVASAESKQYMQNMLDLFKSLSHNTSEDCKLDLMLHICALIKKESTEVNKQSGTHKPFSRAINFEDFRKIILQSYFSQQAVNDNGVQNQDSVLFSNSEDNFLFNFFKSANIGKSRNIEVNKEFEYKFSITSDKKNFINFVKSDYISSLREKLDSSSDFLKAFFLYDKQVSQNSIAKDQSKLKEEFKNFFEIQQLCESMVNFLQLIENLSEEKNIAPDEVLSNYSEIKNIFNEFRQDYLKLINQLHSLIVVENLSHSILNLWEVDKHFCENIKFDIRKSIAIKFNEVIRFKASEELVNLNNSVYENYLIGLVGENIYPDRDNKLIFKPDDNRGYYFKIFILFSPWLHPQSISLINKEKTNLGSKLENYQIKNLWEIMNNFGFWQQLKNEYSFIFDQEIKRQTKIDNLKSAFNYDEEFSKLPNEYWISVIDNLCLWRSLENAQSNDRNNSINTQLTLLDYQDCKLSNHLA